ncbi:potassium transporter Trk [Halobacteriales archaeon QS_6_71_20]|nr:MAG: potassium transporter Trk [Halobacteriales archaeon QS_6_71_20]
MCMGNNSQIVIAGGGRVGFRVAQFFTQRRSEVTIIEKDPDQLDEEESDGITTVRGDATNPAVLSSALTDDTTVIGALTDSDSTNLAVCLAARTFQPDIRTVARITNSDTDEYKQLVDEVVFPERASVKTAVNALSGNDVRTFEEVTGEMEVFDIRVAADSTVAEQRLADIDLPGGSLVISGAGGERTATSETRLEAGEQYIVAADPNAADSVISAFRGE